MEIFRIIYTLELTMTEGYDIINVSYKISKRNNQKMIMVLNYRIRKNIPFLKRICKKRRLSYAIDISKRYSEQIKRKIENGESIGDIFHKYNKMSFILEYGYEFSGKLLCVDDYYKTKKQMISVSNIHSDTKKYYEIDFVQLFDNVTVDYYEYFEKVTRRNIDDEVRRETIYRLYLVRDRDGRTKYNLTSGNYLNGIYNCYNIIIHANNRYEFKMKCDLMGLDIKFFEYRIKRSENGEWIGAFIDVDISGNI